MPQCAQNRVCCLPPKKRQLSTVRTGRTITKETPAADDRLCSSIHTILTSSSNSNQLSFLLPPTKLQLQHATQPPASFSSYRAAAWRRNKNILQQRLPSDYCPPCNAPTLVKLLNHGGGLAAHLHAVHTPWGVRGDKVDDGREKRRAGIDGRIGARRQ